MATKLDEVYIELTARDEKLEKSLDGLTKDMRKLESTSKKTNKTITDGFKKLAITIGAAFSVRAVIDFTKRVVKLASEAEGVRTAFNRIADPNLLNDLNKAVRGTVSEVDLMRQAVRAENFKIPLEQLATFFQFATQRSIQTGESVDYLVDSIINGIGRKSTLVMDNLGISAAELQAEVQKVGDFGAAAGNIIQRELAKAGDVASTTQVTIKQVGAGFENLGVAVGQVAIKFGGDIVKYLGFDSLPDFLKTMTSGIKEFFGIAQNLSGTDIEDWVSSFENLNQEFRTSEAKRLTDDINTLTARLNGMGEAIPEEQVRFYQIQLKQLQAQLGALIKVQNEVDSGLRDQAGNVIKVERAFNAEKATIEEIAEKIKELNQSMLSMRPGTAELANTRKELERLQVLLQGGLEIAPISSAITVFEQLAEAAREYRQEQERLAEIRGLFGAPTQGEAQPTGGVPEAPKPPLEEYTSFENIIDNVGNLAQSAMSNLNGGLARAIIQGRSLNNVLSDTLKLFAQMALQSIFQSIIGTTTGGGSGLLGAIFGGNAPASPVAAATSSINVSGLNASISNLQGNIRALSANIGSQNAQPQFINVNVDGQPLLKNALIPANNAVTRSGFISDTTS